MSVSTGYNSLLGKPIYTLAQRETEKALSSKPNVTVSGVGTDIKGSKTLTNRAKRKAISNSMGFNLVDIAKAKGDKKREQRYWNTHHCQSTLIEHKDKYFGRSCKNRCCTLCLANRKAEIINKYYPVLKNWEEPYFVTLTVKSIKEKKLKRWAFGIKRAFKLITDKYKKRHQRGKGIKLIGIKSLECNFNPKAKTYNPHYHIIVPNKKIALILKKEWLHYWKSQNTVSYAQHIRKVENLERDLIETIKYGSKIFTEPDINKKTKRNQKSTIPPMIYAYALDNIFDAFSGRRIFDRFGFNLPKQPQQTTTSKLLTNYKEWVYEASVHDWVNIDTGELLTGYKMPAELSWLLTNNINNTLH